VANYSDFECFQCIRLTSRNGSTDKGKGFFSGGVGINGVDFCSVKGAASLLAGCEMLTVVVAQTR